MSPAIYPVLLASSDFSPFCFGSSRNYPFLSLFFFPTGSVLVSSFPFSGHLQGVVCWGGAGRAPGSSDWQPLRQGWPDPVGSGLPSAGTEGPNGACFVPLSRHRQQRRGLEVAGSGRSSPGWRCLAHCFSSLNRVSPLQPLLLC